MRLEEMQVKLTTATTMALAGKPHKSVQRALESAPLSFVSTSSNGVSGLLLSIVHWRISYHSYREPEPPKSNVLLPLITQLADSLQWTVSNQMGIVNRAFSYGEATDGLLGI
jgi:hypothetical protein